MAIYHFDVAAVSRRLGQSGIASLAYITGTLQTDERTGCTYDYRHKAREILATGTVGPVNWQAAEAAEKRWNSKVARTIIVALPCELDLAAQVSLLVKLARGLREQHGVACTWAVHAAPDDPRNRHGHLLLTTRRVDVNGAYNEKTRELDVCTTSARVLAHWRGRWALLVNGALQMAGSRAHVSSRSLAARGIMRPARMHLEPQRTEQQRQGYRTAAAKHNAAVDEIERAAAAIARVKRQISILIARRRRARVQHQIKKGRRHLRWRNCTSSPAVTPQGTTTNQRTVSSLISESEPVAPTPKKPVRRR